MFNGCQGKMFLVLLHHDDGENHVLGEKLIELHPDFRPYVVMTDFYGSDRRVESLINGMGFGPVSIERRTELGLFSQSEISLYGKRWKQMEVMIEQALSRAKDQSDVVIATSGVFLGNILLAVLKSPCVFKRLGSAYYVVFEDDNTFVVAPVK